MVEAKLSATNEEGINRLDRVRHWPSRPTAGQVAEHQADASGGPLYWLARLTWPNVCRRRDCGPRQNTIVRLPCAAGRRGRERLPVQSKSICWLVVVATVPSSGPQRRRHLSPAALSHRVDLPLVIFLNLLPSSQKKHSAAAGASHNDDQDADQPTKPPIQSRWRPPHVSSASAYKTFPPLSLWLPSSPLSSSCSSPSCSFCVLEHAVRASLKETFRPQNGPGDLISL